MQREANSPYFLHSFNGCLLMANHVGSTVFGTGVIATNETGYVFL